MIAIFSNSLARLPVAEGSSPSQTAFLYDTTDDAALSFFLCHVGVIFVVVMERLWCYIGD